MSEKADPEVCWFQPSDAFLAGSRSLPDDSGAKVNEIRSPVNDDGCTGPGSLWVRRGGSSTKENNLGPGGFFVLRQCETTPGEKEQSN